MPAEHLNVLAALKSILKARRVTYRQVADAIDVSEPTIKRLFSGGDCTLSRLAAITQAFDLSLMDLLEAASIARDQTFQLTLDEEHFMATNPWYLAFFMQLKNGKSAAELQRENDLDDASIFRYLRRLESMGLVDLLPHNRVRVRVRKTLNLRDDGPLRRAAHAELHTLVDTLGERPRAQESMLTHSNRAMSRGTLRAMTSELQLVAQKYRDVAYREETFVQRSELLSVSWVLGVGEVPGSQGPLPRLVG